LRRFALGCDAEVVVRSVRVPALLVHGQASKD